MKTYFLENIPISIDSHGRLIVEDEPLISLITGAAYNEMLQSSDYGCHDNAACGNAGCANAGCKRS